MEESLTRRLHDIERRYQQEKSDWAITLRQKEEDLNQLKRQFQLEFEKLKEQLEEKEEKVVELKDAFQQERRGLEHQGQSEYRALQSQLETQLRESGNWKAQLALVGSQLTQAEAQHREERARAQEKMARIEQDHREAVQRMDLQLGVREEELKREFSRREQERAQYWEGVVGQMRAEKESLRAQLTHRDEELSRVRIDLAEVERTQNVERARWQTEAEKIRQAAREEALRDLPEALKTRLEAERRHMEQENSGLVQQFKNQLAKASEAQKAIAAKMEIEQKRAEQEHAELVRQLDEKTSVLRQWEEDKTQWEQQTQQFLHRIAQAQLKENTLRDELEKKTQEGNTERAAWAAEQQKVTAELASMQSAQDRQAELEKSLEVLRTESHTLAEQVLEWKKKEQEWEISQARMRDTFNTVKAEVVQLQNERAQREDAWIQKETQWANEKAEWEKEKAAAVAAASTMVSVAPAGPNPESVKALTIIRQQMQEMNTLLTWLKPPVKKDKSLPKAA